MAAPFSLTRHAREVGFEGCGTVHERLEELRVLPHVGNNFGPNLAWCRKVNVQTKIQ